MTEKSLLLIRNILIILTFLAFGVFVAGVLKDERKPKSDPVISLSDAGDAYVSGKP